MRDLKQVNKLFKQIESVEYYGNYIFSATKRKTLGDFGINVYEIEKDGLQKISLNHHKKAQALAIVHDIGMMICVDVDRRPFYYFY